MKLRLKEKPEVECGSSTFNIMSLDEIIVAFKDPETDEWDSQDTCPMRDFEAWVEALQEWKGLGQAFKDKDVIPDNYNQSFREPATSEEKERGWY